MNLRVKEMNLKNILVFGMDKKIETNFLFDDNIYL